MSTPRRFPAHAGGLFAQITNLIKKVSQSIFSGIAKLFNQG